MTHLDPGGEFEDDPPLEEPPVSDEARARAQGWRPQVEFRGDPRMWVDWPEYLAKGESEWPVMRDQNRRMGERLVRQDEKIAGFERTISEQAAAVTAAMALARRADQAGYNRAKAELKAKQREAVEAGDTVGYDQVSEELDALETARAEEEAPVSPPPAPAAPPPPPNAAPNPTVQQFVRENPWFTDTTRPHLRTIMIEFEKAVGAENPGMDLQGILDLALDRMEAAYPEIVPEGEDVRSPPPPPAPRRRAPSAMAPTAPAGQRRAAASPIDAIVDQGERAEARSAYESIKRQDPKFTEAEYMRLYDDPHADALAIRAERK